MPSRTTLAALALLVAFAGCTGPATVTETGTQSPAQANPSSTQNPPSTQAGHSTATPPQSTPTPQDSTGTSTYSTCPGYLSVDAVADPPADATVLPYENLSADRRAEFDAALASGSAELEQGGDGYAFWVDRPYVRHDGTVYRAVVAVC